MKRTLKIVGATLGGLLTMVVLVVCIAMYVVFTPKRLTPIVNRVADSLLTCPHELEEVNLTFVRTFPNFGLAIKGLYIINPVDGAPSDTLLAVPELIVSVDVMKALDGDVVIRRFTLSDAEANLYIAADGATNFDILRLSVDTTETDTTPSQWQLKSLRWDEDMQIRANAVRLKDERDSIDAALQGTQVRLAALRDGARLEVDVEHVSATMGEIRYADGVAMHLSLPVRVENKEERRVRIERADMAVNEFALTVDGVVTALESWTAVQYDCDVTVTTNEWHLSSLMALLPEQYSRMVPKEIVADGDVQMQVHAMGRYDSLTMPVVDAEIWLRNGQGHYDKKVLPYYFDAVDADLMAHVDLNVKTQTTADLKRLYVRTGKTDITLSGKVTDILKGGKEFALANPMCLLNAQMNVHMPDADYWLASDKGTSWVKGQMKGTMKVKTRLDDVTAMNLNKIQLQGDLAIRDFAVQYEDSILADADHLRLTFTAPKVERKSMDKNILSADCQLEADRLHADMKGMPLLADMQNVRICASAEMNTKDTTAIPTLDAEFALGSLVADMDTIHAQTTHAQGKASLAATKRDKTMPRLMVNFSADDMNARMGESIKVNTGALSIEAASRYNKKADNLLLKWNPRLHFDLKQGHADLAALGTPVEVPQIKFNYSNRDFTIDTSRIVLGRSDFSLAGEVKNMGKWLRHQDTLQGTLRFTSDYTDVNEMLALVNRLNSATDTTTVAEDKTSATETTENEPFMVPERVDLALKTVVKRADVFDQHLKNLGGQLYVKDGKLILEEMGFICEAAKLQLTAMYRTPRKNHIYVGLDYHMVDIDLQQLIGMIPQLDTLVPMLKEFRGAAQFHIAAETYVNSHYDIKYSTLRGACSIEGKDLKVLDNETFSTMAKILMFKKKTENKIDSISAQIALYKDEVTVYPFCVTMDNYMVAVGGNHYLDMNFDYHASLLKPLYIGVDVKGNLDDLKIRPAKCRFAKDFRPLFHRDVDTHSAELRQIISSSLKKNVKIQ